MIDVYYFHINLIKKLMMPWQNRITVNSEVRSGKPCLKGTRITVYDILEYLAGGKSEEDILKDFPDLAHDDIRACLAFAATRERRFNGFPSLGRDLWGE